MSDLILHHDPALPFSEKLRLILGCKQPAWRGVTMPRLGFQITPAGEVGAGA